MLCPSVAKGECLSKALDSMYLVWLDLKCALNLVRLSNADVLNSNISRNYLHLLSGIYNLTQIYYLFQANALFWHEIWWWFYETYWTAETTKKKSVLSILPSPAPSSYPSPNCHLRCALCSSFFSGLWT